MSGTSKQQAIDEQLIQLRDWSPAAHLEIEQALPAIRPHGDDVALAWLLACRKLHDYDREAGRAFVRGSGEAERVSETVLKDLKPSTKQRFIALNFDFPSEEIERKIVLNEAAGISPEIVHQLVTAGRKARLLKDHGLEESASTRALVYAANMMNAGLDPIAACQVAMVNPITDDEELAEALMEIVQAHFGA